jgi:hypothetical protein
MGVVFKAVTAGVAQIILIGCCTVLDNTIIPAFRRSALLVTTFGSGGYRNDWDEMCPLYRNVTIVIIIIYFIPLKSQ